MHGAYKHIDGRILQLGKLLPKIDPRTLKLSKYLTSLPTPPISANWTGGVSQFGMMLNGTNSYGNGVPPDGLGDCTCALAGHGVQISRLNTGSGIVTPADATIEQLYEKTCGYIPGNESTDQGGYIINVLNWVRQNAPWMKRKRLGRSGHKHPWQLLAYADPNLGDFAQIQWAISIFQTLGVGLQLPLTAQGQVGPNLVWNVVGDGQTGNSAAGSWGGHCVLVVGYKYVAGDLWFLAVTWGQLQWMTAEFWANYVDECHCLLYRSRVEAFGARYPAALTQLLADLKAVTE